MKLKTALFASLMALCVPLAAQAANPIGSSTAPGANAIPGSGTPAGSTTGGAAAAGANGRMSTPPLGAGGAPLTGDARSGDSSALPPAPSSPGVNMSTPTSPRAGRVSSELGSASFQGLDRNRDGFLSREEMQGSSMGSRFNELDTDRDGRISADELTANGRTSPSRAAPTAR